MTWYRFEGLRGCTPPGALCAGKSVSLMHCYHIKLLKVCFLKEELRTMPQFLALNGLEKYASTELG